MHPPPQFLFVHVNKRCNLRCQHCDFWKLDDSDKPNYLSWERKREILAEFAEMNQAGKVVICGGESMLDLEDYFAIAGACRELGLRALSVINGTRVRRPEMAERLIREGPHEISISLNSHLPELHDETRGVKGAFERAVTALRLLVDARKRLAESDSRINVMGLIFDANYESLEDFYALVLNDIQADKLKLNFIQPSFGQLGHVDEFFATHHRVDPGRLVEIIQHCDRRFGLGLNPHWLEQVRMYFGSLAKGSDLARGWASSCKTSEHICNSYERNIMVDHYGKAMLCFSSQFSGMKLEKPGDLKRFWENSDAIRARMHGCNQFCGISHSVRRETSTLATRRPESSFPSSPSSEPAPALAISQLASRYRFC